VKTVAFLGNPNVGKTSLFNRLTKSSEHVGNWHGVTNREKTKEVVLEGKKMSMTDLPGLYSLSIYSPEEAVTRDAILKRAHDVVVNVCEGGNIFRNFYLTLQLLEANTPVILVVNMIDELEKRGKRIDVRKIENVLGIRVVCASAKFKSGVSNIVSEIEKHEKKEVERKKILKYFQELPLEKVISIISKNAKKHGIDEVFSAIKLMEKDEFIAKKLQLSNGQLLKLESLGDLSENVAMARYSFIDRELGGVIITCRDDHYLPEAKGRQNGWTMVAPTNISTLADNDKEDLTISPLATSNTSHPKLQPPNSSKHLSLLDKIILNKFLAIPIFLLVMLGIFYVVFGVVGGGLSGGLQFLITRFLYLPIRGVLEGANAPKWVVGLICDGVISGVGGVLVFLPQIALLFFFLALLEDTGYMSRIAFLMDGILSKIGLSGRSCFTLLMGFGCTASAVATARSLDDEKVRRKTVLLTPFFSCSAKLPTYFVLAGAFFSTGQPLIVFSMYLLGVFFAFVSAIIFKKTTKHLKDRKKSCIMKRGLSPNSNSFLMEVPPFRVPTIERVFQVVLTHSKHFIIRVATVVFMLNVIMWVLSNFSFSHGYIIGTEYASIFETLGSLIAPIFAPLGFGEWRAVTALLSGIVAKEASLAALESLGGVHSVFSGEYSVISALSFMIFTLLYIPCLAACASIRKEVGGKLMFFSAVFQFGVAYVASLMTFQMGRLFMNHTWIFVVVVAIIVVVVAVSVVCIKKFRKYEKKIHIKKRDKVARVP